MSDHSIAQQKILRIFRLIRTLNQQPGKTITELANLLDIAVRSVYRYLDLIEEIGYAVDRDEAGRYFIFSDTTDDNLPRFEPEEVDLLGRLVREQVPQRRTREGLLQKLFIHSAYKPLAQNLIDVHTARIFRQLDTAIRSQHQARLKNYHSVNSGSIGDRIVEPLTFTPDLSQLLAFEPASGVVKLFKLDRIQDVEVCAGLRTYHQTVRVPDIFGMSGAEDIRVVLLLSHRAYRLLIEEFPVARQYVERLEGAMPYRFETDVQAYEGIGRFVLGLPGEIRVKQPEGLRTYLCEMMEKMLL
ncbi:MAG: hypothetical protein OHK0039_38700 [Bacteroidia bacterium]